MKIEEIWNVFGVPVWTRTPEDQSYVRGFFKVVYESNGGRKVQKLGRGSARVNQPEGKRVGVLEINNGRLSTQAFSGDSLSRQRVVRVIFPGISVSYRKARK